jgi:cysteinyl-tRNA synthetase
MTLSHLGDTMDIHTASRNLIFPHHENENAIAKALTGKPLANHWLHSELLLVDGKMMSAENSNIITLQDVRAEGFSNRVVRFFLLRHHYRKPIEFSFAKLTAARTSLRRLDEFCKKLLCLAPGNPHPEVAAYLTPLENTFSSAMDDDMNISKALGSLFDFIKKVNPILAQGQLDADQKKYILESLEKLNALINIMVLEECPLNPEIDGLIKQREEARKSKDWQNADAVRLKLEEKGIIVTDTATGPVWCLSGGTCEACGAEKCAKK